MHGNGVFTWQDGKKYEGGYVDDKKEGWGVFIWPNGKRYEGNWANGMQNGQGAFYTHNKVRSGNFVNGKLVKA